MNRRDRARRRRIRLRRALGLCLVLLALVVAAGLWRPELFLAAEYARLRWQAGASQAQHEAAGHRWAMLEAGAGPTLVLVHGFTGSKENWLPMIGALGGRYRVIAPDLPGWGDSERRPGENYGFVAQADRLADFLRRLEPAGQPVILVGHSMGGGIAALLAARHPDLVARLVLLDAAGLRFDDNDFSRAVARGEHPFEVSDRATLDRQLGLVFDHPPWVPWPADRALIRRRIADREFELDVLERVGRSAEAEQPGHEASAIRAPTLLLWCRADRIIDVSAAARYAERLADSRTVLLDGCNHMPMMEQPAATAAALHAFIAP